LGAGVAGLTSAASVMAGIPPGDFVFWTRIIVEQHPPAQTKGVGL